MRQVDLAFITGYSVQAISNYANNRSYMSPEAMYTISKALRCGMDDLYEWVRS
ncbi:helix-turn-helix transcriptional regulator [Paenibacillus alvei]|nr:helix-turn-helix transcriptional regulator [Paenibacillus alvei]MCY9705201.1 helix-turn-helix transcriptional regulator [Paenibacillus alvei]MCY9733752.1 helix-turn-helix transcriptional regulator [Paenibacillus alvei]MCY9756224.1 helix-turn-helix transcriptional regulator [Paenibacillus alvei]